MGALYPEGRYNINYNICAAVLCAVLIYVQAKYIGKKQRTTKILEMIEGLVIIQCILDSVSCVMMNLYVPAMHTAVTITYTLALMVDTVVILCMYYFVLIVSGEKDSLSKKELSLRFLPAGIGMTCLIVPPIRDFIWGISEKGKLVYGDGGVLLYIYVFLYIFFVYVIAANYYRELGDKCGVIVTLETIYLVMFIISINKPYFKALNFVVAIMLVIYSLILDGEETEQWRDNSMQDELSGIKNRNGLRYDFPNYVNKDLCVAMLDINKFKIFNDTYGHKCGDDVIRQCGAAIKDMFGGNSYRYGGDEFLILSEVEPDFFYREIALLVREVSEIKLEGTDAKVTITCGYCTGKPYDEQEIRDLINHADDYLYKGKRNHIPIVTTDTVIPETE